MRQRGVEHLMQEDRIEMGVGHGFQERRVEEHVRPVSGCGAHVRADADAGMHRERCEERR